jgi:hypothetical protein
MCIFSISSRAFPRVHTIVSRSIAIREPHDSGITRCLLSDSLLLLTEATITSSALLSRPSLPTVDGKSVYTGPLPSSVSRLPILFSTSNLTNNPIPSIWLLLVLVLDSTLRSSSMTNHFKSTTTWKMISGTQTPSSSTLRLVPTHNLLCGLR